MVDATIGHGGHSFLFGKSLGSEAVLIGLDVDENCLREAKSKLSGLACKVILLRSNFSQITPRLEELGIGRVDFILVDLGVCSAQLTDVQMGLSFQTNMPLDMRFDKSLKTTAADIVNKADEKSLADLIYRLGQDRASRRIARFVAEYRRGQPITSTAQLAAIVCKATAQPAKNRKSKIHPATRTFQALRIAVNGEMENLEKLLDSAPNVLKGTGKIAVISYHSLEDGLVKSNFKQNQKEGLYRIITKKPIVPGRREIADNPRARSAKLRIAEKIAG